MEDEGKKENWDTLAGDLGAEVPESPETPELPENKVQTEPADSSLGLPAELPRSGPSGWDSLAEEFGIASPELAEAPRPADTPAAKPAVGSKAVSKSPASGGEKSVAKASRSAPADAISKKETSFGVGISGSVATSGQEKASKLTGTGSSRTSDSQSAHEQAFGIEAPATDSVEPIVSTSQSVDSSGGETVADVADPSGSQKAESPAAGDGGRTTSFWESIFGPRQETPLPEEPQETPVPEVVETSTPQEPEVVSDRSGERSSEKCAEKEPGARRREDAEGGRPRRRSRRRRSRSGKSGQPQSESSSQSQSSSRSQSSSQKTPDTRVTEVADDLKDDVKEDLEEDGTLASPAEGSSRSRSSKAKPPSHRNIPAWEDAMAFIVDGNLQTRTERRPASSRSGDRGRSRGRRKKKKS